MEEELMINDMTGISPEDANVDYAPSGSNMNIMVTVVIVCAILGLALGIFLGKRAANK